MQAPPKIEQHQPQLAEQAEVYASSVQQRQSLPVTQPELTVRMGWKLLCMPHRPWRAVLLVTPGTSTPAFALVEHCNSEVGKL